MDETLVVIFPPAEYIFYSLVVVIDISDHELNVLAPNEDVTRQYFNMLRILESQAPAKQTATDTINILSNRLSSATLLEDRRAAILGLRSFAKQYPASVASGALRDLLSGLRRDGEDPDTLKVVLETLLMLFQPDEKSPEASEDIPLWLADEFAMRQDNITALLDFLETNEFYLRLYSLQILSQVCAARPQRAQEAIFMAPLGVSRIAAILDDRREAIRNEALLLLVALTPTSAELQKVVAFENSFDRVFAVVEKEGGLTHGSTTVQDCLSLLGNLLKLNTSNQSYFREMGCVRRVTKLLADVIKEEESPDGVSEWMRPQRDINLWGLLAVLQLFLIKGSHGTSMSQDAFWKGGILQHVLQIAFHQTFGPNVRAKALETCADVIRGNASLQEQFGDLAVPALRQRLADTNGHTTPKPGQKPHVTTPAPMEMSNVIESLLELTLEPISVALFDVRLAACNCVKAFFDGHNGIRGHVLRRAIEGHRSGDDSIPNILTVLLEPPNTRSVADPYQQWMAAILLFHLLYDNAEAKVMALKVSETEETDGDEEYEAVTFVQSITSNVVAGVQHPEDERALLGYLMLLSTWLFEDPDAVNDLLGEGSTVQGLASAVKVATPTMPLVAGLCAFVLGIVYEFSTKDSPIPRATLHGVIHKSLSREVYVDRLNKMRESPFIRDFEVMPTTSDGGLPEVYFDQTFVDFFKDNFSRLLRAIDRDPGFEVSIISDGVQKGVSRELVDGLRAELEEQKQAREKAESELITLEQRLQQEELEHRKTRDSTAVELGRIKQINQGLQNNHEEEIQALEQKYTQHHNNLAVNHESTLAQLKREHLTAVEQATRQNKAEKEYIEQRKSSAEREAAKAKEALLKQQAESEKAVGLARKIQDEQQAEIEGLHKNIRNLEEKLAKAHLSHKEAMASVELKATDASSRGDKAEKDLSTFRSKLQKNEEELEKTRTELKSLKSRLTAAQSALESATERARAGESRTKELTKKVSDLEGTVTKQKKDLDVVRKSANQKKKENKDSAPASKPLISESELEELKAAAAKQKDTQTELDDLLVVFADLEAKRATEKKRLKELGEEVSEDEDEDGDEEEDGDDDSEDDAKEDEEDAGEVNSDVD